MQVNSQLKAYDSFVFDQLLLDWSRPLSPEALSPESDMSLDSQVPQHSYSSTSNESLEITKFCDLFEEVKVQGEQIEFLDRLLKVDSPFIQRFVSYKGLKILSKILSNSLREHKFPVDLIGKVLICLDRVTIRPTVLEKFKIYSLVEEVKNHKYASKEIVKKANSLLMKWKDLISSGNVKERDSSSIRLGKSLNSDFNSNSFTTTLIQSKPTELLGKRANPLEDSRKKEANERNIPLTHPSYQSTSKETYISSLEAPKKMVKFSYKGNHDTSYGPKYIPQKINFQQNRFDNTRQNNKGVPFKNSSPTRLYIDPYNSLHDHNYKYHNSNENILYNNVSLINPEINILSNKVSNDHQIANNQNPLDSIIQKSY